MKNQTIKDKDANRDPITGAPGAHPVGTGVGAAGGAAAGAAAGAAVGGPVGAAVGLAAGAVVGGLAGKAGGEAVNPTREDAYWRENYSSRPYFEQNLAYEDYQPAYRTGFEGYTRYRGKRFDEIEADLQRDYARVRGKSRLQWEKAKAAARDAWHRVERALPGDADRDGR